MEGGRWLCFVLWKEGGDCALFYGRREGLCFVLWKEGGDCALFYGRREGTALFYLFKYSISIYPCYSTLTRLIRFCWFDRTISFRIRSVINELSLVLYTTKYIETICLSCLQKGSLFDEVESLRVHSTRMKESRIISLLQGICLGLIALHTLAPTPLAHRYNILYIFYILYILYIHYILYILYKSTYSTYSAYSTYTT